VYKPFERIRVEQRFTAQYHFSLSSFTRATSRALVCFYRLSHLSPIDSERFTAPPCRLAFEVISLFPLRLLFSVFSDNAHPSQPHRSRDLCSIQQPIKPDLRYFLLSSLELRLCRTYKARRVVPPRLQYLRSPNKGRCVSSLMPSMNILIVSVLHHHEKMSSISSNGLSNYSAPTCTSV